MAFGAGSGLMPVHGPHRHPMLLSELGRVELDPRSQLGIEQVHDMPPRSHARHNHVRAPSRSLPGDTSIGTSSLTDVMGLNTADTHPNSTRSSPGVNIHRERPPTSTRS